MQRSPLMYGRAVAILFDSVVKHTYDFDLTPLQPREGSAILRLRLQYHRRDVPTVHSSQLSTLASRAHVKVGIKNAMSSPPPTFTCAP